MGLFSKDKNLEPQKVVESKLRPKNGKLHILMLVSWSKCTTMDFRCDEEYVEEIESVFADMQDKGYEIVKTQHNAISNGSGLGMLCYTTLITYR